MMKNKYQNGKLDFWDHISVTFEAGRGPVHAYTAIP